ncbi:MAG: hypothetical protein ACOCUS_02535 [Polyangiales bacterium]
MEYDLDAAYQAYLARFRERFGDKPDGSFVKFGNHMVQKLTREQFPDRLQTYLDMQKACKQMLSSGSTISDDLMLEYDEAAAWVAIKAPNLLELFRGELGDPDPMSHSSDDLQRKQRS